jgi:hypothetical protein
MSSEYMWKLIVTQFKASPGENPQNYLQKKTPEIESMFFIGVVVIFCACVFFCIHMCIQCLGHFYLLHTAFLTPTSPSLIPSYPCYLAETILLLSLILLKRQYKE